MRRRLRPAYTPLQVEALYAGRYDHRKWPDHRERVRFTTDLLHGSLNGIKLDRAADLSCGDGAILDSLPDEVTKIYGDLTPRHGLNMTGPLDLTIRQLEPVDLYVCTETLEHLDNPDQVLRDIRQRARWLLLSTPETEGGNDNPEHYWEWDSEGMEQTLRAARFDPFHHLLYDLTAIPGSYCFQFWICR